MGASVIFIQREIRETAGYDGFLRVTLGRILELQFTHLMSDLVSDDTSPSVDGMHVLAAGFSEWYCAGSRPISLGWDWVIEADRQEMRLERMGLPRSNVMLIDRRGFDYGWIESLKVLETVVDALPWRKEIWHHLRRRPPA